MESKAKILKIDLRVSSLCNFSRISNLITETHVINQTSEVVWIEKLDAVVASVD